MLDPSYHGSGKIIKQIRKKRPDTLMEEILMICATLEEANYFEQYFIEHMNTLVPFGYNFQKGALFNCSRYPILQLLKKYKISKKKLNTDE